MPIFKNINDLMKHIEENKPKYLVGHVIHNHKCQACGEIADIKIISEYDGECQNCFKTVKIDYVEN